MRGVNKVILVGNLGADPERRTANNGNAIASVSIATSERWKDKNTGETQERTEWHRVVFFGRLAEVVCEYARKGSKLYVEGRLQTRKWQAQDGGDRYTTETVADNMQLLDSQGGGYKQNNQQYNVNQSHNQSNQNQPAVQSAPQQPFSPSEPPSTESNFDDDIPF